MTGLNALIPVTIAAAFTFGMVLALLGSIKLPLAERLKLDEIRIGGLLSVLNLALIPMVLVSGILVDFMGVKGILVVGSLLTAFGIFDLGISRTYLGTLGAIAALGAGGSCLSVSAVVLMPRAFFEQNPAASVNLGNVFFGLGALITPTLIDILLRRFEFRTSLILVAILSLASAASAIFTPAEFFPLPESHGSFTSVLASPLLWMTSLTFFLYCPLEGALGTWATTFLKEMGFRDRRPALLLSGFWLAFLASRLLTAFLQQREILPQGSEAWLIIGLAIAAAVVLGNLAGTHKHDNAAFGLLAVGAFLGPIFPTLVGILFKEFPRDHGTAYGIMFGLGATGSLVFPPVMGAYARRTSVRTALRIPLLLSLLVSATAIILAL